MSLPIQQAPHAICDVPADWASDFSQCLYEWQGLEAGILALLAAAAGAVFILRQIKQNEDHRRDEIRREHTSARVALPLTLSSMSELLQEMSDQIAQRFETFAQEQQAADGPILIMNAGIQSFDPLVLPPTIVPAFQDFVKSLDNDLDVRHVGELITSLQILVARYRSFDPQSAAGEDALVSLLIDCATVGHLNDSLYEYARYANDEPFSVLGTLSAEAWGQIRGKAHSLLFFRQNPDPMMVAINERIDGYIEAEASPWHGSFTSD